MSDPTPLDHAQRAMADAPDDPVPRLRFYGTLAGSELVLLLEREPDGNTIAPRVFDLDEGRFVMVFDDEARLSGFTGAVAPYVALPGRALSGVLAGQGLGLGVNLGTEAAALLPAAAVDWWAATLAPEPEPVDLRPEAVTPPGPLPEPLLAALEARLTAAAGLAGCAWLAGLRAGARADHVLAFVDVVDGAEHALARSVAEAVRFSGVENAALHVAFFAADAPAVGHLARVGLRIDLPPLAAPALPKAIADPDVPPRLR